MTSQRKGLFNTSGAGQGFRWFRLGKRKAFARARRATARRAIPILTPLEQRHLLSFTATWIGQNGSDFVGTVARSPNDYQDVVIHLSGLSNTVSEIYVQRYGGGAWDYTPSSSTNAFFQASSGNPEEGDLYLEPSFNDPINYWYELIRVSYVDGSTEDYTTLHSGTPVDPNLRDPGRELSAQWLGQDGNDWTGNGPSVGPDGIPDFHLKVSNISAGATVSSLVLTANPGTSSALSWQFGTNPQGYSNAEFLNRVSSGHGTDTADYFANPSPSLNNGAPLSLLITYSDQNRSGKTDTVPTSAGLMVANIDPTLTMPQTPVSNFATATAHSTSQDAGFPGNAHIVLDTLPNPQTAATIQAAVLSNQAGSTWVYGSPTPYTGIGLDLLDLRLMSSLNDVNSIPTEGKNLIIVAAVNNVLHFRIFDDDGNRVVDTDEKRLTEQSRQIEDLRKQLESLWPPHELTRSDKDRVITAVASIVGYIPRISPLSMSYDPGSGVFSFPPVRDEESATLTLRLLFVDGTQAVARVAGTTSDPRRRDQPVGTSSENVATAAQLGDAVNRQIANIHLAAGIYLMSAPLNLNYPVKITADPGASMVFTPSPTDPSWTSAPGAIGVWASHVSLDGFAISFQGDSASWAYTGGGTRAVIQSAGNGGKVDLSYTNLNIQAPEAHIAGEEAVHLMNFDPSDSGQIIHNILKGGTIILWNGPWQILNNDYQGTPTNTFSYSVFFIRNEHDVLIQGNHIHSVNPVTPVEVTYRFLVFGASDTGRGFNDVIQNNTVDGDIGRPNTDNSNNPEIILTEQYQPRFEGTPSSVSPDGYVLQVPYMRGPIATTGDVVAILSGPHAGQWRLIAQALSPTQYLLDSPLPEGNYAIAIGRGWVHDTYQDNTIDLRGTNPGNGALILTGGHFGTRVLNNTFLGSNAISIFGDPTEGAFSGTNPPFWGWTHLPIFGIAIDGNTFVDASVSVGVNHNQYVKSSSGRTYFSGSFTNNAIEWSAGAQPGVTVGIPAQNGEAAYTHQNFPWLDDGELVLNLQGNWGVRSDGVVAATIQVVAGTINQGAMENQTLILPTSP